MCGFIAQLVEHRTGIAEVMGSNPVEALIFFRLLLSNCLNWKIYCDDHSSIHLQPQYKYELFHIYFTSLHCTKKNELNKLTSLPMCGFIAQLVEHRTGIAEVMGSNPVEALIFFRLLLSNCLNWKIYCDDHSSLHLQKWQLQNMTNHDLKRLKLKLVTPPLLMIIQLLAARDPSKWSMWFAEWNFKRKHW